MLSPNSILHQGRYCITRKIWETAAASLYEAHDNLFGQDVLIHEGPDPRSGGPKLVDRDADSVQFTVNFNRLRSFSHEAIASLRDHFYHAGRKYIVTEPVRGRTVSQSTSQGFSPMNDASVILGIAKIVEAFEKMRATESSLSYLHSDPGHVVIAPDGGFKYLYFGSFSTGDAASRDGSKKALSDSPFMPLEVIWPGLDLASQKAISNSYDEPTLESLELPPDLRSDISTFGSIAYFLITGVVPHGALERSIEILDGNADPLLPPHLLDSSISSEISDVVMTAMSLNREDRFDGFETFLHNLRSITAANVAAKSASTELFDESDLLEIPEFGTVSVPTAPRIPAAKVPTPSKAIHRSTSVNLSDLRRSAVDVRVPAEASESFIPDAKSASAAAQTAATEIVTLFPAATYSTSDSELFAGNAAQKSWFLRPAVLGAVLLAILGIIGWFAISTFTTGKASAVNQVDTRSTLSAETPKQEVSPISTTGQQVTAEPVLSSSEPRQPSDPSKETSPAPTGGSPKTRPAVADARTRAESKPTESAPVPKAKKKVTVDDLISDN
ncbi:MAG: hypothetical protein ABJA02_01545 [Acidobacteriota bacterium]